MWLLKKIAGALFEKSAHSGIFMTYRLNKGLITQNPNSFDAKWLKIGQKLIFRHNPSTTMGQKF